jgi:hypothetical protein
VFVVLYFLFDYLCFCVFAVLILDLFEVQCQTPRETESKTCVGPLSDFKTDPQISTQLPANPTARTDVCGLPPGRRIPIARLALGRWISCRWREVCATQGIPYPRLGGGMALLVSPNAPAA